MNSTKNLTISPRLAKNFRRNFIERLIELGLLFSGIIAVLITIAILYILISEAIPFSSM